MSTLRLTRGEQVRRFHRHLACKTCGATPGMPCLRMPAPRSFPGRVRLANEHPHQGRGRTRERCGDVDSGHRLTGCNLPPNHGGEWHLSRQGQQWRAASPHIRTEERY